MKNGVTHIPHSTDRIPIDKNYIHISYKYFQCISYYFLSFNNNLLI